MTRSSRSVPRLAAAAAFAASIAAAMPAAATPTYNVRDLGSWNPVAMNDIGQMVGYDFFNRGVFYDNATSTLTEIGVPPGGFCAGPAAVNAGGTVAVSVCVDATNPNLKQAYTWNAGAWQALGMLPGGAVSMANGINRSGRVVGMGNDATSGEQGFDDKHGLMKHTGTLPGGSWSDAHAINDVGQIVGTSAVDAGGQVGHAFRDVAGVLADLGPEGRPDLRSTALAINAGGDVAGLVQVDGNPQRYEPFVWHAGTMARLGFLDLGDGATDQTAQRVAINKDGLVVGNFAEPSMHYRSVAFLYDGAMHDINTLLTPKAARAGWNVQWAAAIDSRGRIIGAADDAHGFFHAVLLTPAP